MDTKNLILEIDSEIAKLEQAKAVLLALDNTSTPTGSKKRGRPVGSGVKNVVPSIKPKKRVMSAEGRASIAEAQRKRWAAVKGTGKKTAAPAKASAATASEK